MVVGRKREKPQEKEREYGDFELHCVCRPVRITRKRRSEGCREEARLSYILYTAGTGQSNPLLAGHVIFLCQTRVYDVVSAVLPGARDKQKSTAAQMR